MPQFDPSTYAPQLIWLAITFVMLYVLMTKVALPRIGEVLEERQRRIGEDLKKTEALKIEAEAAVEAYGKLIDEACAESQEAIKAVRNEAFAEASKRQAELGEALAARIAEGEGRVAAAKDKAVGEIRALSAEVGGAIVKRLLGEVPDKVSLNTAVEAAVKERT